MKRKKLAGIICSAILMLSFVSLTAFASANEIEETTEVSSDVTDEETQETVETESSEEISTEISIEDVTVEESDVVLEEVDETIETTDSTMEIGSNAEVEPVSTEASEVTEETTEVVGINLYDYESCSYTPASYSEYLACEYDVRADADPNAAVLVTLSQGTEVTVIGFNEHTPWLQVQVDGEVGYITMTSLTFDASGNAEVISDEEAEAMWADFE